MWTLKNVSLYKYIKQTGKVVPMEAVLGTDSTLPCKKLSGMNCRHNPIASETFAKERRFPFAMMIHNEHRHMPHTASLVSSEKFKSDVGVHKVEPAIFSKLQYYQIQHQQRYSQIISVLIFHR